jgi:hypothetical protein
MWRIVDGVGYWPTQPRERLELGRKSGRSLRTFGVDVMPLLFYLPIILWMGMLGVTHDEFCVPAKVKAKKR